MSFSKISALAGVIALASKVAAHGTVTGIVADGVYYEGYHANFQYLQAQPVVVGWSIPEDLSNGFIAPDAYTNSDIICHLNATNAQTSATVAAGGTVELQWTAWPSSHHGPVIDYLANCGGDCKTVDKTTLEFFKIDGVGLIDDTTVPGTWASDQLIANNNSWVVTIPSDIAPGNYVLRHEIIALHSAGTVDGAQNYPQCVNIEVTGTGTATPPGVLGTALYSETDPGIEINIYQSLSTYVVPGPTLYSGAVSVTQTTVPITSIAPVGTAASPAVTEAATSAAVVATSSAAAVITSAVSSGTGSPGLALQTSGAPYQNTTSTKKSACKAKSSSTSAAAIVTTSANVAAVATSEATFATSVTIPTSLPASTSAVESTGTVSIPAATSSSAEATSTSSAEVTMPTGTTLSNLLSWISDFYNKFKGTSYNGNTVARRHTRDVAHAEMARFDRVGGFEAKATGTGAGFAHPTHHHHPHGTGFAKPTGASGFAAPTAGRHFAAAEFHF